MALATAERLWNFLGLSTADATSELSQLSQYVTAADAYIKRYTRKPYLDLAGPSVAPVTMYFDSPNSPFLVIGGPVQSVASVWSDRAGNYGQNPAGSFQPQTLLTAGLDYALKVDQPDGTSRSGVVVRVGASWAPAFRRSFGLLSVSVEPAPGAVKVQFTPGWAGAVPADLELACCMLAARMRQAAPWGTSLDSVGQEGVSISHGEGAKGGLLTREIRQILDPYRSLVMGN